MNAIYVAAICFGGAGLAFIGYMLGVSKELGRDIEPERWSGQ